MPSVGQQIAHLTGQTLRSGTSEPTLHPASPTATISPMPSPPATDSAPAALQPVDKKQHGQYLQAQHAVVTTTFERVPTPIAAPAPTPVPAGPQPMDKAATIKLGLAYLRIVCGGSDPKRLEANVDAFAKEMRAVLGDQFSTGVMTGFASRTGKILTFLSDFHHNPVKASLITGAIFGVVAAHACPPLGLFIDWALIGVAAVDIGDGLADALHHALNGEAFESGQAAGSAVADTILALIAVDGAAKVADKIDDVANVQAHIGNALARLTGGKLKTLVQTVGPKLVDLAKQSRAYAFPIKASPSAIASVDAGQAVIALSDKALGNGGAASSSSQAPRITPPSPRPSPPRPSPPASSQPVTKPAAGNLPRHGVRLEP